MIVNPPPVHVKSSSPIAIYDSAARTSGAWNDAIPAPEASASSIIRELRFEDLARSAFHAMACEAGWDGYYAPAPNEMSVTLTVGILGNLKNSELNPFSVLQSADGGIGISFRGRENRRAVLEILNDGSASYMLYGKGGPMQSGDFDATGDLTPIFQKLSEYLS